MIFIACVYLLLSCGIYVGVHICYFFFFKQKTAYEVRISDWSSDVCSSDLMAAGVQQAAEQATGEAADEAADQHRTPLREMIEIGIDDAEEIGRASCRERVCQYV